MPLSAISTAMVGPMEIGERHWGGGRLVDLPGNVYKS
jgi:hypothetical protein